MVRWLMTFQRLSLCVVGAMLVIPTAACSLKARGVSAAPTKTSVGKGNSTDITSAALPAPARTSGLIPVRGVDARDLRAQNGNAFSWDGRIAILATQGFNLPSPDGPYFFDFGSDKLTNGGWTIRVVRPEAFSMDTDGLPIFSEKSGSLSPIHRVRVDSKEADPAYAKPPCNDSPVNCPKEGYIIYLKGFGYALAVLPNPAFPVNPFRSDSQGKAIANGAYETYEMTVLVENSFKSADNPDFGMRLGLRNLRVVVQNPRTPQAQVVEGTTLSGVDAGALAYGRFTELSTTSGKPVHCVEPSITADGRLLVCQGNLDGSSLGQIIWYFNDTPLATDNWSDASSILTLNTVATSGRIVDGVLFYQRYPLSRRPLLTPDGTPYGPFSNTGFPGAYPWISPGGEVLTTTTMRDAIYGTRRAGYSVIGSWTGWALRTIDGPINRGRWGQRVGADYTATSPVIYSALGGAFGTQWEPYQDRPQSVIPYSPYRPALPMIGSASGIYSEVTFEDLDYLVIYHMNEKLYFPVPMGSSTSESVDPLGGYVRQTGAVADTSGNFQHGVLNGAQFPFELLALTQPPAPVGNSTPLGLPSDDNYGRVGQAVFFGPSSYIEVPHYNAAGSSAFPQLSESGSLTAELFVFIEPSAQFPFPGPQMLLSKANLFSMQLETDGTISASVRDKSGSWYISPHTTVKVAIRAWQHVAMTYDGNIGLLRIYLEGSLVLEKQTSTHGLYISTASLIIGPGIPKTGVKPEFPPELGLDEVKISTFARSRKEILASAYRIDQTSAPVGALILPSGPDKFPAREPVDNPLDGGKVDLGQKLFSDKLLSLNNNVSCASCHNPASAFADANRFSKGTTGAQGTRHAPPVFNRVLSEGQMLDGRAESLEAQVLLPLMNPTEMGMSESLVVSRLNADSDYVQRFLGVFGDAPSVANTAKAIAAFERTILSGNSPADRFDSGDSSALSASAQAGRLLFFGKARCTECHRGPNYTDESFHDNGLTTHSDLGRKAITGNPRDAFHFKTPTLRNVCGTAPYMHNGSFTNIHDVIARYNAGGNDGETVPLNLTDTEAQNLEEFVCALSGPIVFGRASLR